MKILFNILVTLVSLFIIMSCRHIGPEPITEAVGTPTPVATYTWLRADPPGAIQSVSNIQLGYEDDKTIIAYLSGEGGAKSVNIKSFSKSSGWSDIATNVVDTFSVGSPWFNAFSTFKLIATTDSDGYVYVYNYKDGVLSEFGTNPVVGPNCHEPSIDSTYRAAGYNYIKLVYIDGNDGNRIRRKLALTLGEALVDDWMMLCAIPEEVITTDRINETGNISIVAPPVSTYTGGFFVIYSNPNGNALGLVQSGGDIYEFISFNGDNPISGPISNCSSYETASMRVFAFRDDGNDGKATVIKSFSDYYVVFDDASYGPARNISVSIIGYVYVAFADETANDNLVVKYAGLDKHWTDLSVPQASVSSCVVGELNPGSICIAYSSKSEGNSLKLIYTE